VKGVQKLPEKPPKDWDTPLDHVDEKYLKDDRFHEDVTEFNRRYLYWDELVYRIDDPERRSALWAMMKFLRMMRYERVRISKCEMRYSLIPEIVKGLHTIDRYLAGNIQIHNKTIRLEQSYIINSLMEESIASSILEGAATTRKIAKEMLRKGRKPKTHAEQMILNNYEAMRFIRDKKDAPLTKDLILEIQRIVTKGTIDAEYVGKFRTDNSVVVADSEDGTIHYTPPDYTEIEGFIERFCKFANIKSESLEQTSSSFIHPVMKGIVLHYLMGYYHPFNDGNGRTARSIFYWYVLSQGYWLFEYMAISRIILKSKKKYDLSYLYTEYDDNDVTYFIKYNIDCIIQALNELLSYLERKQSEQNATKAIITKIKDINSRQATILQYMMEHSDEHFTITQIMQMFDVVYQTARTDLMHLVDLEHVIVKKRGREFLFIFNEHSKLWDEKKLPKIKDNKDKQLTFKEV